MNLKLSLFAATLLISSTAHDAAAQQGPTCLKAVDITKRLSDKYGETPVAYGLQSNGDLLQVYASNEKGTWTVVTTTPAGVSCIVAIGKGWISIPPPPTDPLA